MTTWAIKGWAERFTCNQAARLKEPKWVPIPLRTGNERFRRLMSNAKGRDAFAIFIGLVEIAAKMVRPGVLADSRGPLSLDSLEFRLGAPASAIEAAIDLLGSESFGWLVKIPDHVQETAHSGSGKTTDRRQADDGRTTNRHDSSSDRDDSSPVRREIITPSESVSVSESGSESGSSEPARAPKYRSVLEATPIFAEYPEHRRTKRHESIRAIHEALDTIEARGEPDPKAWLKARVIAYRQSPVGKGRWALGAVNWFSGGCYDDPPSAWEHADENEAPKKTRAQIALEKSGTTL